MVPCSDSLRQSLGFSNKCCPLAEPHLIGSLFYVGIQIIFLLSWWLLENHAVGPIFQGSKFYADVSLLVARKV